MNLGCVNLMLQGLDSTPTVMGVRTCSLILMPLLSLLLEEVVIARGFGVWTGLSCSFEVEDFRLRLWASCFVISYLVWADAGV